ncbi:MAG: hypothetical protein WBE21_15245, partial [Candidatus Acidiferrales bacterium]
RCADRRLRWRYLHRFSIRTFHFLTVFRPRRVDTGWPHDEWPQWLKPFLRTAFYGTAKAVP